jgi:hypothetical protein
MDLSRHWQITARTHRVPDNPDTRYAFAKGARAALIEVVDAAIEAAFVDPQMEDSILRVNDQIGRFANAAIEDRPKPAPVQYAPSHDMLPPIDVLTGAAPADPAPTTEDALRDQIKALQTALEIAKPYLLNAASRLPGQVRAKVDLQAINAALHNTGATGAQAADDARDAARWRTLLNTYVLFTNNERGTNAEGPRHTLTIMLANPNTPGAPESRDVKVLTDFLDAAASADFLLK